METIAAREAKNGFGRLLDTSQRTPVVIEENGRPVAVVVSMHAYEALQSELADLRANEETAHLLSTAANRASLLASIAEHRAGGVRVVEGVPGDEP